MFLLLELIFHMYLENLIQICFMNNVIIFLYISLSLSITQLIEREMYSFLKCTFDHWPLDASFRIVSKFSFMDCSNFPQINVHIVHDFFFPLAP